jgi:membrane associated rhomboid family serine protease
MMGSALEREWGTLKYNVFYLCGILFSIIGGMSLGYATNIYINLSLLFAFALLFPDFELRLFFIIPIKVKYLAIIDAAFFAYIIVISSWPVRVAIIASFLHIVLFFWNQIGTGIRNITIKTSYWIRRKRKSNITRWK